jgi:hypothetical protein
MIPDLQAFAVPLAPCCMYENHGLEEEVLPQQGIG